MMADFNSRQMRLQMRDGAKKRWLEGRLRQLTQDEPMELGSEVNAWMVQEEQEHAAMDGLMASLELYDNMELEEEYDNNTTMMEWNEAMEHEYLDRLLENTGDNINNDMDISFNILVDVPAEEPVSMTSTDDDDEQTCWLDGEPVAWQGQGTEDIKISEGAYRSGGTWWLSGWISPKAKSNHSMHAVQEATKLCRSCTCTMEDIGVKNRILTTTFRNCNGEIHSFKRKRNRTTKWHRTEGCCSERKGGSLPRSFVVAGRRKTERQPRRQPEIGRGGASSMVEAGGVLGQDTQAISFGGSGAKFTALRNRRGVRAGQDGLIQKRLNLTVVNVGGGKFSLSLGKKRKVI